VDAEVYWEGRLVGYLRGVVVDQPYYHGEWESTWDPAFERAFHTLQSRLSPGGLGVLPVTFRAPEGSSSAPAVAMVRPAPATAPSFRFGAEGVLPGVVCEPIGEPAARRCERCGCFISMYRLRLVATATRCWDCQVATERADGGAGLR
jgi:hypothetical protein